MAEAPQFESPVVSSYPPVGEATLVLSDESRASKLLVRASVDGSPAGRLGTGFGSSRAEDGVLVCGQRPGEWLIVGGADAVAAFASTLDVSGHVSLVDQTHSRALFRLHGADSARVLAKICGLDWADPMTPDGAVVSASVAGVGCDIVRNDIVRDDGAGRPAYLLACDRSYGQYLFDAILDAGAEHGIAASTALS